MNSQASGYNSVSTAFDQLNPAVQKWIWKQGWKGLRAIQEKAVAPILAKQRDVIVTAATAGGKTEAAFLPVISNCIKQIEHIEHIEQYGEGFGALYISPLKALINDQAQRLESLCNLAKLDITPWHGDISASVKNKARRKPCGLILITPESLEAMFVRRGTQITSLFGALNYVIIDELHAFIGTERGIQLLSLLSRLEHVLKRTIIRIGLSATLGDMNIAAQALRPGGNTPPEIIFDDSENRELRVQVRGYEIGGSSDDENDPWKIVSHLLKNLRGKSNLIFARSRQRVEGLTDQLRRMCDRMGVPNEFFAHHGNLSKELRENLEKRLKDGKLPTSAIATTTLELGIDIGDVISVAQIGAPHSIAGLRQRLGRSGRRDDAPSVLRIYTEEVLLTAKSPFPDQLRQDTVMSVAAVRLLIEKWCETPHNSALHLSTLTHQVLALIKQYGGMGAQALYRQLCTEGVFRSVSEALFIRLLHQMGSDKTQLIEQADDGALLLGEIGERIADRYDFYAVFQTFEEYRLECAGQTLGQLSAKSLLIPGQYMIFAGRRWQVEDIDVEAKVVYVKPATGGALPYFDGMGGEDTSDRLVEEMRLVYQDTTPATFCDASAKRFLSEGRKAFATANLGAAAFIVKDNESYLFPWLGTRRQTTLSHWLNTFDDIKAECEGIVIHTEASRTILMQALIKIANGPPPDPMAIAKQIKMKDNQKYHQYLSDDLLNEELARDRLDVKGLPDVVRKMMNL